jgi:hypothetical protein
MTFPQWPDVPKQVQEFACTKTGLCDCASEGDHDARRAARAVEASLPPGATVWDCPTCGRDPKTCYCTDALRAISEARDE